MSADGKRKAAAPPVAIDLEAADEAETHESGVFFFPTMLLMSWGSSSSILYSSGEELYLQLKKDLL